MTSSSKEHASDWRRQRLPPRGVREINKWDGFGKHATVAAENSLRNIIKEGSNRSIQKQLPNVNKTHALLVMESWETYFPITHQKAVSARKHLSSRNATISFAYGNPVFPLGELNLAIVSWATKKRKVVCSPFLARASDIDTKCNGQSHENFEWLRSDDAINRTFPPFISTCAHNLVNFQSPNLQS